MSTMDTTNTNENEMIKVSDDEAINAKFNAKLQDLPQEHDLRNSLAQE